jgi:uncharacterized membrane protein
LPHSEGRNRIQSVDALRGLVMIVMALDHVRDFVSHSAQLFSPDDLTRTTTALFFTRWITHFCAPTFMFTAGIGAYFWLQGCGRTTMALSRFLWSRGVWLLLLELTAMRFALTFHLFEGPVILLVLWALGACMIALGFLVWLPARVLAALSVLIILLHNTLDPVQPKQFGSMAWLWNVLHRPGGFPVGGAFLVVSYPLIPWIFVMAAGFCFGRVVKMEEAARRRWMLRLGVGMTIGFVLLRAVNVYGDVRPWAGGLLSFLNCTKYPPSLDYLLMTLGPALLTMAFLDRFRFSANNPLIVFGRVPLFFFVLHFYAAHLLALLLAWTRYGHAGFMWNALPAVGGDPAAFPTDYGVGLTGVYLCWLAIVVLFYPLCRWFAGVKERRRDWWLSYL